MTKEKLLAQFLEQLSKSDSVRQAEPLLCMLSAKLLLLTQNESASSITGSTSEKALRTQVLSSIKENDWSAVSLLAARIALSQSALPEQNVEARAQAFKAP